MAEHIELSAALHPCNIMTYLIVFIREDWWSIGPRAYASSGQYMLHLKCPTGYCYSSSDTGANESSELRSKSCTEVYT